MEKKKFQMPHTYIIIFGVILVAALLTCFIPLGKYDTKEITYTVNGSEKTRTVVDPDSFQYILDENDNKVEVPGLIVETESEKAEWLGAQKRNELRKERRREGY